MLSGLLKYPLKKKDEQAFIYTRLSLLDQHHYANVTLHLWQSYLDICVRQHRWPVSLFF